MYNILVCDDEKDIVLAIEFYLEESGYKVYKAYNGKEALDLILKDNIFDLVLADVMMPVMDGIELTRRIREISSVPILILSAKGELKIRLMAWKVVLMTT